MREPYGILADIMATNVDITRKEKENALATMKRFTQGVRSSGVVQKLKSLKFQERKHSTLKRKNQALRRIQKTAERDFMRKLGKVK